MVVVIYAKIVYQNRLRAPLPLFFPVRMRCALRCTDVSELKFRSKIFYSVLAWSEHFNKSGNQKICNFMLYSFYYERFTKINRMSCQKWLLLILGSIRNSILQTLIEIFNCNILAVFRRRCNEFENPSVFHHCPKAGRINEILNLKSMRQI